MLAEALLPVADAVGVGADLDYPPALEAVGCRLSGRLRKLGTLLGSG
jgi:hypothetical protein